MAASRAVADALAALETAAERGKVRESELEQAVEHLALSSAELIALREELAGRGVAVMDDCGAGAERTAYDNRALARYSIDALDQYLREATRHPLLTGEQERRLARRIERGDLAAKETLITHNLRLVVSIARRYEGGSLALLDLIQEGTLGLIRAAEKFDWRRGLRFSTYATLWIKQSIGKAVTERSRMIRLPAEIAWRERRIERARETETLALGRPPSIAELATAAGVSERDVEAIDRAARVVLSLDRPLDEREDSTVGDWLRADAETGQEVMLSLERDAVRRAVAQLGEPAATIVRARFGLDGDPAPQSYAAISARLGLPVRAVRRIERSALTDLARLRELQGISDAA